MRLSRRTTMLRVLDALSSSAIVTTADLVDLLHGDDPDGGPTYPEHQVRTAVRDLREAGVDVRMTCEYFLGQCRPAVGGGTRGRTFEALRSGPIELGPLSKLAGASEGCVAVALSELRTLGVSVVSSKGYRINWTSIDVVSPCQERIAA